MHRFTCGCEHGAPRGGGESAGEAGAELEAQDSPHGQTPLLLAASQGDRGVMSLLIDTGANPNARRFDGGAPLCAAALFGQAGAVRVLLGTNPPPPLTMTDEQYTYTPLRTAASSGHLDVVRELMQHPGIEDVDVVQMLMQRSGAEDGGGESYGVWGLFIRPHRGRHVHRHHSNAG